MSSNIIPPLLSESPPPPPTAADDVEEDEFGDFIGSGENGFDGFESSSCPASPEASPQKLSIPKDIDINSNLEDEMLTVLDINREKDFLESPVPDPGLFADVVVNSELKCDPVDVDLENSKNEINSLSNVNIPYLSVSAEDDLNEPHRLSTSVNLTSSIIDALKRESEISDDGQSNAEHEQFKFDMSNSYERDEEEHNLKHERDLKNNQEETFHEYTSIEYEPEKKEEIIGSHDATPEFNSFDSYEPDDEKIELNETDQHLDEEPNRFAFPDEHEDTNDDQKAQIKNEDNRRVDDDDFADFADFSTADDDEEDDFGEFASSSTRTETVQETVDLSELETITEEEAYDRAKRMFEVAFPPFQTTCEECLIEEIEKGCKIFEMLKDITDTPALSMQWAKSSSQKLLLRALSIDERNILPAWTSSTPIFASNLSLQPLEPVKTESPSPVPVVPSNPAKSEPEEIPNIQFDWNSTELRNPLEGNSHLETDFDDKKPEQPKQPQSKNTDLSIFDVQSTSVEATPSTTVKQDRLNNVPEDTNTYATWLDTFTTESGPAVADDDDFGEFTQPTVQTNTPNEENTKNVVAEDEFTDFQSSLPEKRTIVPPPLLETLTPTPVYQNVPNAPSTAQINWPDPGITDEDIRKLEEAFSKPKEEKEVQLVSEKAAQSKQPSVRPTQPPKGNHWPKQTKHHPTEEEWSDFVSATNKSSSPLHKLSGSDKERTSSPDLPLSVFNLGSIQPAKQPIPVITSQGLVQTKLSANMTPVRTGGGLSSIGKQYFSFGKPPPPPAVQKVDDDDEWGEFVSSNTLPQDPATLNGYRRQGNNVQYSIFSQYHHHHHRSASEGGKSVMASTLPELDFIAPKSRTTSGRKK